MRSLYLPLLASAGLVLFATSCEQRRVSCAVRSDDFTVKYTAGKIVSGSGDCDQALTIETVGFFTHVAALNPSGKISSISIRPLGTGEIAQAAATEVPVDPDEPDGDQKPAALDKVATHSPTSVGKFGSLFPDNSDICVVPTLSAAEVEYDAFIIPADDGEEPPPEGDGGAPDGGVTDGGAPDARTDGGVTEGGVTDGGVTDGGVTEGGVTDAGATDVPRADAATKSNASADAADTGGGMCEMPPPGDGEEPPPEDIVFDATHIRYEWSNLKVFVTAGITGSIVSGDLTYTQFNGATEACKATYKVRAVSPVIECADECGKPSDDLCHGAGIPDEVSVKCDPDHLVCVLADDDKHLP